MRIVLFLIAFSQLVAGPHAITYKLASRFGDWMTLYFQTRYLGEMSGIDFCYRTFVHSRYVTIENGASPLLENLWQYHRSFDVGSTENLMEFFLHISDPESPPALFNLLYSVDEISEWETFAEGGNFLLNVPSDFFDRIRSQIAPKIEVPHLTEPGRLNVAAHVRVLSGGDYPEWSFVKFPLRHPNTRYHRRQIERIYDWCQRPMHVFLFSDTDKPQELLEEFQSHFEGKDITFGIQMLENGDKTHAVQDYFAMQEFDALISTQSNFSKTASKLGDFDMIFYPTHNKKRLAGEPPRPSEVDQVQIIAKKSEWFPFEIDLIIEEIE